MSTEHVLARPRTHYVIPAALAYSLFSVPHFFFHLTHMELATPGEAVFLTTLNAAVALIGLALVPLTAARDRRDRLRGAGPVDG